MFEGGVALRPELEAKLIERNSHLGKQVIKMVTCFGMIRSNNDMLLIKTYIAPLFNLVDLDV